MMASHGSPLFVHDFIEDRRELLERWDVAFVQKALDAGNKSDSTVRIGMRFPDGDTSVSVEVPCTISSHALLSIFRACSAAYKLGKVEGENETIGGLRRFLRIPDPSPEDKVAVGY